MAGGRGKYQPRLPDSSCAYSGRLQPLVVLDEKAFSAAHVIANRR